MLSGIRTALEVSRPAWPRRLPHAYGRVVAKRIAQEKALIILAWVFGGNSPFLRGYLDSYRLAPHFEHTWPRYIWFMGIQSLHA